MNNSVGSAIEKIKLQEQDNDSKLKEKREYEVIVSSLNKAIKETIQSIEKSQTEYEHLKKKTDSLRSELAVEKTKKDALLAQVQASKEELEFLRKEFEHGISKVWELRSRLCSAVHTVADECDIRALLIKPMCAEFTPPPVKNVAEKDCSQISTYENRLKTAIERREKAIRERERLQVEPDVGEEFIRIRNALQYSMEMVSKLSK